MDWHRDLPTWPLHDRSKRIHHPPHQWHVQDIGSGPVVLLLHGAGASTHSWRDMIPHLAPRHRVIALDLPGQGFTRVGARHRLGLPAMAEDIATLCAAQGWHPALIVGHSAGGAIALELARRLHDARDTPPDIACINAALSPFEGVAGWLFPLLAKVLAANPLSAAMFTLGPDKTGRARRLIEGTGSHLSPEALAFYARLIADRAHVEGTLRMMAQWDVAPLLQHLPDIPNRCLLLTGAEDRAVPPEVSRRATARLPRAAHVSMDALGHLAHEEDPAGVARLLLTPDLWPG